MIITLLGRVLKYRLSMAMTCCLIHMTHMRVCINVYNTMRSRTVQNSNAILPDICFVGGRVPPGSAAICGERRSTEKVTEITVIDTLR